MHEGLSTYLTKHKDDIEGHYKWQFDESLPQKRFGFSFSGKTPFQKTLELKRQLAEAVRKARNVETKVRLADYFIKDWGGIRRFSHTEKMVSSLDALIASKAPPKGAQFPYENISSWSKWLSVICPDWAPIYDARVAYSLNGINFLQGGLSKAFPIPTGRNTKTALIDTSTLVVMARLSKGPDSKNEDIGSAHYWRPNEVYSQYLSSIRTTHQQLWREKPIVYTEALLFALADTVIFSDVVKRLSGSRGN